MTQLPYINILQALKLQKYCFPIILQFKTHIIYTYLQYTWNVHMITMIWYGKKGG